MTSLLGIEDQDACISIDFPLTSGRSWGGGCRIAATSKPLNFKPEVHGPLFSLTLLEPPRPLLWLVRGETRKDARNSATGGSGRKWILNAIRAQAAVSKVVTFIIIKYSIDQVSSWVASTGDTCIDCTTLLGHRRLSWEVEGRQKCG